MKRTDVTQRYATQTQGKNKTAHEAETQEDATPQCSQNGRRIAIR